MAAQHESSDCVRRNCCGAASQMHCLSVFEGDLTSQHHEDREARVEGRFAVQHDTLQPEVRVCRFRQDRGPEPSRTDQLLDLLATSASAFDSFQRQIEAEPEMAVTYAVQIEVSPLQQDGQVLQLLQLDQKHTVIDRVQNAGRHIDHIARIHQDSVEQAQHRADVLAHHQRLEVVAGYVLFQA